MKNEDLNSMYVYTIYTHVYKSLCFLSTDAGNVIIRWTYMWYMLARVLIHEKRNLQRPWRKSPVVRDRSTAFTLRVQEDCRKTLVRNTRDGGWKQTRGVKGGGSWGKKPVRRRRDLAPLSSQEATFTGTSLLFFLLKRGREGAGRRKEKKHFRKVRRRPPSKIGRPADPAVIRTLSLSRSWYHPVARRLVRVWKRFTILLPHDKCLFLFFFLFFFFRSIVR